MTGLKGERVHKCELCGRVFTRNEHLQRHKREVHDGVKRNQTTESAAHAPLTQATLVSSAGPTYPIGYPPASYGQQYPTSTFPPFVNMTSTHGFNPVASTGPHPYNIGPANSGYYQLNSAPLYQKPNPPPNTQSSSASSNTQASSSQSPQNSRDSKNKKDKEDKKNTQKGGHKKQG